MSIDKPATHADLIGDVIDRVVLAPNSNTVPSLYTRLVIACTLSRHRGWLIYLIRFGSLLSCVRCIKCKSSQYIKLLKYLNQGNLLNMIIYLIYGDENHCKLVKCTCASSEIMSFE